MKNTRVHYIIIPILIVFLAICSFQRINKDKEIETKPKNKISNTVPQIGNCYSYKEGDDYYGVIIIEIGKDHVLSVGILGEVKKQIFDISDFEKGKLVYCTTEILKGYPVDGLWTGFFLDDELKVFNERFQFIGKLELNRSKIDENGGGTLISGSQINLKRLQSPRILKGSVIHNEPVKNILKSSVE